MREKAHAHLEDYVYGRIQFDVHRLNGVAAVRASQLVPQSPHHLSRVPGGLDEVGFAVPPVPGWWEPLERACLCCLTCMRPRTERRPLHHAPSSPIK